MSSKPTSKTSKKRSRGPEEEDGSEDNRLSSNDTVSSSSLNNDRTVYLEGLPFDATEEDIKLFFASVGPIVSLRLPRWHDSGRLRGYGHVEFESSAQAEAALDLNGNYIGKRFVKIDRPMVPRSVQKSATSAEAAPIVRPPGCKTIFIKNLPYECTEDEIKEAFKVYGKIANVRLARWGHTNQLKGFGYVDFIKEESADIAVRKAGAVTLQGRSISCDFEVGKPKGSFRSGGSGDSASYKKLKK